MSDLKTLAIVAIFGLIGAVASCSAEAVTIYNKPEYYKQWITAGNSECARPFFEYQAPAAAPASQWRYKIGLVNYLLHENFNYVPDGLSDIWCVPDGDITAYWEGDCDSFAMRGAIALANAGIPKGNIFLATVLTYRGWVNNLAENPYHPRWVTADHMILIAVDGNNRWWVLDSGNATLTLLDDTDYQARGIVSFSNYGAGTNNDTAAGFVRFWLGD